MGEVKLLPSCDYCDAEGDEYQYPDGSLARLCLDHAKGLFCLRCGSFTGGTEDLFVFGEWECSHCYIDLPPDDDVDIDEWGGLWKWAEE